MVIPDKDILNNEFIDPIDRSNELWRIADEYTKVYKEEAQ